MCQTWKTQTCINIFCHSYLPQSIKCDVKPVWGEIDEILYVARHCSPVEGERKDEDSHGRHLDNNHDNKNLNLNLDNEQSHWAELAIFWSNLQLRCEKERQANHPSSREEES